VLAGRADKFAHSLVHGRRQVLIRLHAVRVFGHRLSPFSFQATQTPSILFLLATISSSWTKPLQTYLVKKPRHIRNICADSERIAVPVKHCSFWRLQQAESRLHRKTVAQFRQAPALAAKESLDVQTNSLPSHLYVLSHLVVSPAGGRLVRAPLGTKCAIPSIAGHYVQPLNPPKTLPPKGMIELDPVVRTRLYKLPWLPFPINRA